MPQPPADLPLPAVEPAEYADRLARVRTAMAETPLVATALRRHGPGEPCYRTGQTAWSFVHTAVHYRGRRARTG